MSSRLLYKYDCYQFSYRYTLKDIMANLFGHFTMRIPTVKNLSSSSQLFILLTWFLFFIGLVLPVSNAQNNSSTSSLQGLCNKDQLPDPCMLGETYGDPGDCTVYYECITGSTVPELQYCESGSKYDIKKKKCRVEKPVMKREIKCQPPCDDENKNKKQKVVPTPSTPNADTAVPKGSQNATEEATQSITDPNEALTTEDDDTINSAGGFKKDNDTIVPVVVPNQGAAVPGASDNTTAGDTAVTEAQTEAEDVATTATSTLPPTPAPTPAPTPQPTTKSTTKLATTTHAGVVVVDTDGDPGYDIVSTAPNNSSGSIGGVDETKDGGISTATIGIAVGIILAILIASVAVFLLICHIRKKKFSKEKQIVSIENPKYKKAGGDKHAYRFSRDASLLVNDKSANNNSTEKLAFIPGRKRPAPSPSKDKTKEKRKAPPPPNPFTGEIDDDEFKPPTFRHDSSDLYERDSVGSAGEDIELSTFSAPSSTFGTGTGTFGKGKKFGGTAPNKATPNGRLQPQQSRSTDYSSEEDDSDEEDENLLGRKYKSTDMDDAVFNEEPAAKNVNNSMDAYLSAYDQALK